MLLDFKEVNFVKFKFVIVVKKIWCFFSVNVFIIYLDNILLTRFTKYIALLGLIKPSDLTILL